MMAGMTWTTTTTFEKLFRKMPSDRCPSRYEDIRSSSVENKLAPSSSSSSASSSSSSSSSSSQNDEKGLLPFDLRSLDLRDLLHSSEEIDDDEDAGSSIADNKSEGSFLQFHSKFVRWNRAKDCFLPSAQFIQTFLTHWNFTFKCLAYNNINRLNNFAVNQTTLWQFCSTFEIDVIAFCEADNSVLFTSHAIPSIHIHFVLFTASSSNVSSPATP